jgi:hypothetical protein
MDRQTTDREGGRLHQNSPNRVVRRLALVSVRVRISRGAKIVQSAAQNVRL